MMWKRIVGVLLVLICALAAAAAYLQDKIYPRFEHSRVRAGDFTRLYSSAELKADFLYMTAQIEHIHPHASAIRSARFASTESAILGSINRSMTRTEFDALASQINGEYLDGHTTMLPPSEEWDAYSAHDRVVPIVVSIEADRIQVTKSLGTTAIPAAAELISLNGIRSEELMGALTARVSGESAAFRRAYASRTFALNVWLLGIRPPFRIDYRVSRGGAPTSVSDPGIPYTRWSVAADSAKQDPHRLEIKDQVALIVMRSFSSKLHDDIHVFLADAFRRIKASHVQAVILDLRDCEGGDTRLSDELQTYLSDYQLPAVKSVSVKSTAEIKAMYRTLLPEGFRWIPLNRMVPMLRGIQDAPDGGFFDFHPESSNPVRRKHPNALAFKGPLYVLVSASTYSTCLIAAVPYKYWQRGILIGEPPAESLTFFGDTYEFDLPNTKLQAVVSHKIFTLFGSSEVNSQLTPDIPVTVSQPDAYAIALQQVAHRSVANP